MLSPAGAFLIQVSGPGVVEVHQASRGAIDVIAYGTNASSTITITQTRPRFHAPAQLLSIQNLMIRSGQLGGLTAGPVALTGRMTPLTNPMATLQLGSVGPKAQVDINGGLGSMSVGSINLGPAGHMAISGDLNSVASTANSSGLSSLSSMTVGTMNLDGGRFVIGRDADVPITVEGSLTISHDGQFSIGRDLVSTLTVDGSLRLDTGGQLLVGRNLNNLSVVGNIIVNPSGSGIAVGGALNGLSVNGYFQGQGGTNAPSAIDLGVGLNFTGLTILGGISGQGGLIDANIRAGGSVSGVNIVYGTYQSTIQSNTSMTT